MLRRSALLVSLCLLAGGFIAIRRAAIPSEREARVAEVCEAARAEQYDRAIQLSGRLAGSDPQGRIAAECRCWALLGRGRAGDCADMIDRILLQDEARDWLPHRALTSLVIRMRLANGRPIEATTLARAAAVVHPGDVRMLELELSARSRVESEADVLTSMESRLDEDSAAYALRLVLAVAHLGRQDAGASMRVLGELPPPAGHPMLLAWFEERSRAIALSGDIRGLNRLFSEWAGTGADPVDLRARYALRVSVAQLEDPETDEVDLLRTALVDQEQLSDPRLRWALYRRLIGVLIARERVDEALAVYDEASEIVEFPNLSRDDIERSALANPQVGSSQEPVERGILAFRLAAGHREAGRLWISSPIGAAADSAYEATDLAPGESVEIERALAVHPVRWVFRDDAGRVRASGTRWPERGAKVDVEISPGAALSELQTRIQAPIRPADGRRRLFAIVLDCSDWRLIQYLRARSELPLLEYLIAHHTSAVLESTPAFTAAAMEALVWPHRAEGVSFLGLVQRMGLELGGLASVGSNPLAFLSAVLPESQSLFEVIGSGDKVAANMLFSHGGIDAGRHAQVLGPDGREREMQLERSHRPLSREERSHFPGLDVEPRQLRRIETIAAELDIALEVVRADEVDLLLLRIEPLDLLTHAWFRGLLQPGQDDARSPLLETYRYIDWRLAELYAEIDRDDRLIVMSDHGIRTPMEHETDALFVLAGEGVPHSRAPGMPHLRGVPRLVADLLGVETDWPAEGFGIGAEVMPSRETAEVAEGVAGEGAGEGAVAGDAVAGDAVAGEGAGEG